MHIIYDPPACIQHNACKQKRCVCMQYVKKVVVNKQIIVVSRRKATLPRLLVFWCGGLVLYFMLQMLSRSTAAETSRPLSVGRIFAFFQGLAYFGGVTSRAVRRQQFVRVAVPSPVFSERQSSPRGHIISCAHRRGGHTLKVAQWTACKSILFSGYKIRLLFGWVQRPV